MKRLILGCLLLLLTFSGIGCGCQPGVPGAKALPPEAREILFGEDSFFLDPITVGIKEEKARLDRLKRRNEQYRRYREARKRGELLAIPPIFIPIPPPVPRDLNCADRKRLLQEFLVKNGYAKFLTYRYYGRDGEKKKAELFFFTDKIKPYLVEARRFGVPLGTQLLLGRRVLKSIDFVREFERAEEDSFFADPAELTLTFWKVAFSYTIRTELPGFPKSDKIFKGRGVVIFCEWKNRWELGELHLPSEPDPLSVSIFINEEIRHLIDDLLKE